MMKHMVDCFGWWCGGGWWGGGGGGGRGEWGLTYRRLDGGDVFIFAALGMACVHHARAYGFL